MAANDDSAGSATTTVDLTNCENEPIHRPGAIQPHGVLLVGHGEQLEIAYVSDNVETLFHFPASELFGRPLKSVFAEDEAEHWATMVRGITDTRPVYLFTVGIRNLDEHFDAIAHRRGDLVFVEFEPSHKDRNLTAPDLYRHVQSAISELQRAETVDGICEVCALQVRKISGFDRVMVYRFDSEWNGQVVAEERRNDLEPFLGLHYPASDIPA